MSETKSSKKLKAAIIGCGGRGTDHARGYCASEQTEIAAVCDPLPEALQKIQQYNFYTTKGTAGEAGTGLGLMLCKEFIARNGGTMLIESFPGKGSTFTFTLPAATE